MEQQLSMWDESKMVVMALKPTDRILRTIVEINGRLYFEQRHKRPYPIGHKYYQYTLPSRAEISRWHFERGVIEEIGRWKTERKKE